MKAKDVVDEFLAQWNTSRKDPTVPLAEFEEYYTDISAIFERDDQFNAALTAAWVIPEPKPKPEVTICPTFMLGR